MQVQPVDRLSYQPLIDAALREDLGSAGDVTTNSVVLPDSVITARIVCRQDGVLAGLPVALDVFGTYEPDIVIEPLRRDGEVVRAGDCVAALEGPARAILTCERTALNFLIRLSGIASATRRAVEAVGPHKARIACTRKTTPGLRLIEKYAVRAGGGVNHRFGLFDGVLIKDNHIVAAGGLAAAVARVRAAVGHMTKVEVECDTLAQVELALDVGVDAILLDNMTPDDITIAVDLVAGRALTEASGGITPQSVGDYAATGVDLISLGWLTHSVTGLDIGLDV